MGVKTSSGAGAVWEVFVAPPPPQGYNTRHPPPRYILKIKIPVTVRRGISKRSHEKIGDCEQSTVDYN